MVYYYTIEILHEEQLQIRFDQLTTAVRRENTATVHFAVSTKRGLARAS